MRQAFGVRDLLRLGCEVHVVDPDAGARETAVAYGAASAEESLPDISGCEGVVIATPASDHLKRIEAVRRYNVPVFVEKPMTVDHRHARRICAMKHPPSHGGHGAAVITRRVGRGVDTSLAGGHPGLSVLSAKVRYHPRKAYRRE
ncbi:MAG: Gfo/Idh/MocA family oxidoreductase [Gammaproteobacteria bacterium]|nr:Gfo/Idh/MocA family oxidoreductase [Gammaproteobacteria bacterium]